MNGEEDWLLSCFVEGILRVSCYFKTIRFSFIPGDLNGVAHSLPKFSCNLKVVLSGVDHFVSG